MQGLRQQCRASLGVHCRASYSNTTVCRTSMAGRAMLPCVATASDAIPQTDSQVWGEGSERVVKFESDPVSERPFPIF